MKVETADLAERQVQMTVEVPDDQIQPALRAAARRLSKNLKIPGFRPGKAPYDVVAGRLGEDTLFEEALDDIGQSIYKQALEETELEPFAAGMLEEIVSRQPLVLRYTVPLEPTIDLGDHRSLRVDWEEPEVEDEQVEEVLEELRQGQALIEPVERAAGMGDVIVVDVKGQLQDPPEGESGQLVDESNASLLLEEETDWPIPGIADELIGLSAGDEKSVEHTFPDDYAGETLQGKTAQFHFKVLDVKSRLVPEWSDNLAQNMGDFDDLLALRIQVRENLTAEVESRARQTYRDEVMDALSEQAQIVYPPTLLEREVDDMFHDFHHQLERRNLSLDDYLKIEGKTAEDVREELRPQAESRLMRGLILSEVVEQENLTVTESEVDEALGNMLEQFGEEADRVRKQLDTPSYRRQIEVDLLTSKAVERLMAIARGEEIIDEPPSVEAAPAMAEAADEEVEKES